MRLLATRLVALVCALTWLVFPGFGLIDLGVTWNAEWPVVLEAGWGLFTTVLVGGPFLAIAVRPRRAGPPVAVLLVALAALLISTAAGLEAELLSYVAVLGVETAGVTALLHGIPGREPLRPAVWSVRPTLLALAVLGAVPWLVEAAGLYRSNRAGLGIVIGDVTNGVDHYAVQGALAVALPALALLAACWPRGRRFAGLSAGPCAVYLGLVSLAFPDTWAALGPAEAVCCMAWGLLLAVLGAVPSRLQLGELGLEVVEAERAL